MDKQQNWKAPFRGAEPISAHVKIPGSKSVTNRALILATLAKTPSKLRHPLLSRDTELMATGLKKMGIGIISDANGLTITPAKLNGPASIDVGNAGTVMRFLLPLAGLATGLISFDGDPRSHERPLGPLILALEKLGTLVEHNASYCLPLAINGRGFINGGVIEIDASSSSQFVSALLLAGPAMRDGITLKHSGGQLPSLPHIEMTLQMLTQFGGRTDAKVKNQWVVEPGDLHGVDIVIEPDLSNAAPFLSIAMISGGEITIDDWPAESSQLGDQLRTILKDMGADISFSSKGLTLKGNGVIHGIDIDLHDVGELTPAITALAALADSPSSLRGIAHLRQHETDRLAALAREINSLGGKVREEESALHITPAPLHSGIFHTYDDHRLATAGAVIGLAVKGIEVENIETTRKTIPDFPALWHSIFTSENEKA